MQKFEKSQRSRKTVEFPAGLDEELRALAAVMDMTLSELIRRGMERMVAHEKRRAQGFEIGAFKEDDEGRITRAYLD